MNQEHDASGMRPVDDTRRRLVGGLAMLGAATLLPRRSPAAIPAGSIDMHHHVFPAQFLDIARVQTANPAIVEQWTLQRTLEEMDRNGIGMAVVSITQPGVWFGNVEQGRALARQCNEYMARLRVDHPGRFGFFAALPLPDVEGSLRELAYALDVLKADGIGLMTSYGDKWPGDPLFAPVFAELNRRKALVGFHPTGADCCRGLLPGVTPNLIEYPQDTARAILSLLYSGTLARQGDIRYLFSHAGGTLPVLAGRVAQLATPKDRAAWMPQGLNHELQKLWFEVANSANAAAIGALTSIVPTSQVMLGSDYPYVPIGVTNIGLESLGFDAATLAAIRRGNALRALGQS